MITVNIYTTSYNKRYEKSRWAQIWEILTKGYTEHQSSIILSEQVALNYAEAIKNAMESVKNFKQSNKK